MKTTTQKALSTLTIFAALAVGSIGAYAAGAEEPKAQLPTVSPVLPSIGAFDVPPPSLDLPAQTTRPVTIVASAPRTVKGSPDRVWRCGAPVALLSDETQTVRHCEWVAQ